MASRAYTSKPPLIALAGYRPLLKVPTSLDSGSGVEDYYNDDYDEADDFGAETHRYPFGLNAYTRRRIFGWLSALVFLVGAAILVLSVLNLKTYWEEQKALEEAWPIYSLDRYTYGTSSSLHLGNQLVRVQALDQQLLPGRSNNSSRLIVIGDVHGHRIALEKLLDKINFAPQDHVIFAGDMISKGPDSVGVVEIAQKINASCVRGNHEDRILSTHEVRKHFGPEGGNLNDSGSDDENTLDDDLEEDEPFTFSALLVRKKDEKLARKFGNSHLSWLASCPIILDVGMIPSFGHLLVVHAGLVPGVKLDKQDPFEVMNMRSIDLKTNVPSARSKDGMSWTKVWNHFQMKSPEAARRIVAYGHDAATGLDIKKYSFGLDSGCGNRDRLSALVVNPGGNHEIFHVRCRKHE